MVQEGAMNYHEWIPRPPLGLFVDRVWYMENDARAGGRDRLLPTGTVELVVSLDPVPGRIYPRDELSKGSHFEAVVCGPHSEFFTIDTDRKEEVVGVHFRPGGAWPFFEPPPDQMHNSHVSLDLLWGASAAAELRERLLEAPTPERKLREMSQVLEEQVVRPLSPLPAVAYALREFGNQQRWRTVAEVTQQIGLSQRRFIQVFREAVGLSPKLFCRIGRFQQVLQHIQRGTSVGWSQLAMSCGFYDQAHFIHEFQAFAGINPSAYLTSKGERLNHLPV
jgi:AraC-like DNA-binding protein